jgi:type 1 glutamine amidotransferase
MRTTRILLSALVLAAIALPGQAAEDAPRILLIGKDRDHPPQTHEYMAECQLLARCLEQNGAKAIVSDGWPTDPAMLEGVDAIVLYTAVGGNVLFADEARRQQVEALLRKGVGLVAIHWSTDAGEGTPAEKQMEYLGGWFNRAFSDIPVCDSEVRRTAPEHPIARGWASFPMKDEYYIKLKFADGITPVMNATVEGTDYVVGWAYERPGGGRSFATVCGHFHDCFKLPAFRRVLANGILWAAGGEVPASGAVVDLSEADLVLPPDPREKP